MADHDIDDLRVALVSRLEEWCETMPDPNRAFVGIAGAEGGLSARDIVRQVREGTPFGEKLIRRWIKLAVEREMTADPLFDVRSR
jgi:hypothetical protein